MPKQPESRLQLRIRHALETAWPHSWWFKVHGGPFQPAGIPDLIGCVNGRFVALEVKRPGESPSRIQRATIARLRSAGAIVAVVTSPEQALGVVREATSAPAAKRRCPSCGKMTRVTTAGCDHCDLEDK